MLSLSQPVDSAAALKSINTIIYENYKLIPKELLCEVNFLNQKKNLSSADLRKVTEIIGSYFHWTKKYLGYPFDKKKIKVEYSPRSGMDIFYVSLGYFIFFLLFGFSIFTLAGSVILLGINERLSFHEHLLLTITLLCVLSTLSMVVFQPRK